MVGVNLSREPTPDTCQGQISWHYDRAEIIADGVVHAVGVCLGFIGAVTIIVMAVKTARIDCRADLGLRRRPRHDALTLSGL